MKNGVVLILTIAMICLVCASGVMSANPGQSQAEKPGLRVMTYNVMAGYRLRGERLSQTVKLIQESKADIVGFQEVRGCAEKLAKLLGWSMVRQGRDSAILTRHEIMKSYEGGCRVKLDSGQEIYVLSLHLPSYPYQPYELLGIGKTHLKTEQEAIASAEKARGQSLATVLEHIHALPDKHIPVFVTGDFNEPSHLDWTKAAANAKRHPIKVAYPTSTAMAKAGFIDAWRKFYPDEMKHPGDTWTPRSKPDNPKVHHDRIDFIYFKGKQVSLLKAEIVGENKKNADIVISPYPSDHRAVVATFMLPKP